MVIKIGKNSGTKSGSPDHSMNQINPIPDQDVGDHGGANGAHRHDCLK